MNLRDKILAAADRPLVKVDVPEWDTAVYIRCMSGTERDEWERATYIEGKASREDILSKLLVHTVYDEAGQRAFTLEDARALSGKNVNVLLRLFERAQAINGIGPKDVDDLAKNSSSAPADNSTSA